MSIAVIIKCSKNDAIDSDNKVITLNERVKYGKNDCEN